MNPISIAAALLNFLVLPITARAASTCRQCATGNDTCRSQPGANQAVCAADLDACTTAAAEACKDALNNCLQDEIDRETCESDYEDCTKWCHEDERALSAGVYGVVVKDKWVGLMRISIQEHCAYFRAELWWQEGSIENAILEAGVSGSIWLAMLGCCYKSPQLLIVAAKFDPTLILMHQICLSHFVAH